MSTGHFAVSSAAQLGSGKFIAQSQNRLAKWQETSTMIAKIARSIKFVRRLQRLEWPPSQDSAEENEPPQRLQPEECALPAGTNNRRHLNFKIAGTSEQVCLNEAASHPATDMHWGANRIQWGG